MQWLGKQASLANATPRDVLVRHLDNEDSYIVLDLVQQYVNQLVMRKSSKRKAYSVIRSYFAHNRCALPADPDSESGETAPSSSEALKKGHLQGNSQR